MAHTAQLPNEKMNYGISRNILCPYEQKITPGPGAAHMPYYARTHARAAGSSPLLYRTYHTHAPAHAHAMLILRPRTVS